jgi:ribonuclease HI
MYILEFDGLFRGVQGGANSATKCGFMCYGWLIRRSGHMVARGHGTYLRSDDATSNAAEYLALIEGLEALLDMGITSERILVIGDAKTIINQMKGTSVSNVSRIKKLSSRARRIARKFDNIDFLWVPRRDNHAADRLSRRALRQFKQDPHLFDYAMSYLLNEQKKHKKNPPLFPILDLRIMQPRNVEL